MNSQKPSVKKVILDLCGGTGSWSKPYKDAGYDVLVITLPEYDVTKWREYPELVDLVESGKVYGVLAAPPCTQFSFARSTGKTMRDLKAGTAIVKAVLEIIWECQFKLKSNNAKETPLKFWALENPYGLMRRFLGHPVTIFNPWMWGDMYQKKTCLWGYFTTPKPRITQYKTTKFDKLHMRDLPKLPEGYFSPVENKRQSMRAITPQGFAKAFYEANK